MSAVVDHTQFLGGTIPPLTLSFPGVRESVTDTQVRPGRTHNKLIGPKSWALGKIMSHFELIRCGNLKLVS